MWMNALVVPIVSERIRFENLETILSLVLVVSCVVLCAVVLIRSRKRYKFCPKCRSATEIGWRTEKHGLSSPKIRVRVKGIRVGFGSEKIAVIRCPGCGWEIDLGK